MNIIKWFHMMLLSQLPPQLKADKMAVHASASEPLISRAGDVETAVIQGSNVQIHEVGQRVMIGKYMYTRTNFYIDQSRKYVGKRTLTKYLNIKWLHWIYVPIFLGSLFSEFNYIATFVMFGVNFVVFVIYTQHMYVNIVTMWHVLKQPSVPDHQLPRNNAFIEIQLDHCEALYAASFRAGIGFIARSTTRETVEFQVFRKSTVRVMKNCVAVSTLCFIGSLFMFLYCYIWGIVLILKGRY